MQFQDRRIMHLLRCAVLLALVLVAAALVLQPATPVQAAGPGGSITITGPQQDSPPDNFPDELPATGGGKPPAEMTIWHWLSLLGGVVALGLGAAVGLRSKPI